MNLSFPNYIWILPILFSCASQGPASGGPPDSEGPKLISITPYNGTVYLAKDQKIKLIFDEMLDPVSVKSSISIYPEDIKYKAKVRGRKIIITPENHWPYNRVIRFTMSRKIRDYQKNMMSAPIEIVLSTGEYIPKGEIHGILKNYTSGEIVETGLFPWPISDSSNAYQKIEVDEDGNFQFSNIPLSKYIIAAVEGGINQIEKQIQSKNYALISEEYIHLHEDDPIDTVQLYYSEPLERLKITSIEMVSQHCVNLLMNDKSDELFFLDSLLSPDDSVSIQLIKTNRLEKYILPEYTFVLPTFTDTIPPSYVSSGFQDGMFQIIFNEPVITSSAAVTIKVDTLQTLIPFEQRTVNTLILPQLEDSVSTIQLTGVHILDWAGNQFKDSIKTISIYYPPVLENIVGGNILGRIEYKGEFPVVIKAVQIDKEQSYYAISEKGKFKVYNIPAGLYEIQAFETLNDLDPSIYFSGKWKPFTRAAKFVQFPDTIDVRAHWDVEGINLKIE